MLTEEQERECAALKKLFVEKSPLSLRAFVKKFKLGSPSNLSQYLNGRRALNLKIATTLAEALGITVADFSPRLAREIERMSAATEVQPVPLANLKRIPVISKVQAGALTDCGQLPPSQTCIDNGDYVLVDGEMPDGTFAMRVEGRSMEPVFQSGDIIVLDPTLRPQPGDFVVAARENVADGADVTFKKYRVRGIAPDGSEVFELVPLNQDFPTIRSDAVKCTVLGVLVEHRRRYRK
jgi:SOS-response transcriptional repressor LexA